jgi:hypothetical protein
VARNLVRRGVAAVLAPQLRVGQPAWLAFCQTLYTSLANMKRIDVAVVEARQAMAVENDDLGWGAPVFFTRCFDGFLFDDGTLPKEPLPEDWQASVDSRLNSLRIRTASRETMTRWGQEPNPPRRNGR